MKAKNRIELESLYTAKQSSFYKVSDHPDTTTKEVDFAKRIVKGVSNTLMYFDTDQDVLIVGSTKKTIGDRGPHSSGNGPKIKNVKDHIITRRVGVPVELDERKVDGRMVQYFESRMMTNTDGNDTLIEYQEGGIDQHSIGFRYRDIELVTADDEDWSKWLGAIINPKDAEEYGYMFIVKEIEQFEFSPVSFGANKLTPYLGVKSGNKAGLQLKVYERLDFLYKALEGGRQSDERMEEYKMETLQLKQIISELFDAEPDIKATLIKSRQNKESTEIKTVSNDEFQQWLSKTNF